MTGDATTTPIKQLGGYRLLDRIGEGGMGVVYRAAGSDGRPVAVKALRPHVAGDQEGRDRFAREVRAMRRVRGPHVAEVLDADVTADTPYVVTRFVDGPPLYQVVAEGGPLSGKALGRLGQGLAEALGEIHAAGVVHRDLKPGNVLMVGGDPVVIDFGIAQVADESRLTSTGMLVGTPGYLAPEVIEGRPATWASDVHSLAATLAFAATGRPPFGRGPFEAVAFRVTSGRADLNGVPEWLLPVLRTAMARDPGQRPRPVQVASWMGSPGRAPLAAGAAAAAVPPVLGTVTPRPTRQLTVAADAAQVPPAGAVAPREPPADQQPARSWPPRVVRRRPVLSLLALLVVAAAGASAPFVTVLWLGVAFLVARTVDRQSIFVRQRRERRGKAASDVVVAASALPWHMARSALFTVVTVPLAALGGGAVVVLVALFAPAELHLTNTHVVGGLFVAASAVLAWWGIEGEGLRSGAHRVFQLVSTPRPVAVVAGLVFAVVTVGLVLEAVSGPVDWWPLDGGPDSWIGSVLQWLREHRFIG